MEESIKRRSFLKYGAATTAAAAFIITGCNDDDDPVNTGDAESVDLGAGDTGVLNYAFALEQLEAGFYTTVVAHSAFSTTFSTSEQAVLTDIRDHEIAHREFFRAALGDKAIRDLTPDFSSIDFGNRASVLGAAKTFEDLGVAAYNGAGNLLSDDTLLLIAGKIVSVEARHAAAIRDLINPKSTDFAGDDVVDANGLDGAKSPSDVLTAASKYIKNKITFDRLPNS